ncbi:MAG: FAD-dependent oxidoreductase [Actinobacteria bacterium]|nr:FAD-dependent oxidoreductase [Actinomycetota bacterium]
MSGGLAGVVVVGAGLAGATVAASLRTVGHEGPVVVLGDERHLPYQRPPLSKDHLKTEGKELLPIRPEAFWIKNEVEFVLGAPAVAVDRRDKRVLMADGRAFDYEHLVLATGASNRPLRGAEGSLGLRTAEEASLLAATLRPGARLVVIGAGFIGMEVAAVARARGVEVVVVEALDRPMSRLVSVPLSEWFEVLHREAGVRLVTNQRVEAVKGDLVHLGGGEVLGADAVLVAVGVTPNTVLAEEAGLQVDDGIVVDAHLRTSDPAIRAVGDCARFPSTDGSTRRLESVQNASDQARTVANAIIGKPEPYLSVPWFWSEQFGHRLQIAGVAPPDSTTLLRGEPGSEDGFSILRLVDGRLASVESIDRPRDHLAARKLLGADGAVDSIDLDAASDPHVPLHDSVAPAKFADRPRR